MQRRRYEVLVSIPRDLRFIRSQIDRAARRPAGDEVRLTATMAAAERACELLGRLTGSPPLWLALQRQFLVHGWSFQDLEELEDLQVEALPIVRVLNELRSRLPAHNQYGSPDPERLAERAWESFREVRDQAVENIQASGTALGSGTTTIRVRVRDAAVVDYTHELLQRLRDELDWQLADARRYERQRQAEGELTRAEREEADRESERRWRGVLRICVEAVTVAASITTVIVQAPDVWQDIATYAAELVDLIGEVGEALTRHTALLGMVIAIRQTDQALVEIDDASRSQPRDSRRTSPTLEADTAYQTWLQSDAEAIAHEQPAAVVETVEPGVVAGYTSAGTEVAGQPGREGEEPQRARDGQ